MREILFRGKRIDNGEWLEGNIIINHDFVAIMSYSGCQHWHDIIEINSSTIGQYTGLTDKNGKKIFEGDIIQYNTYDDFDCHSVVNFGKYKQDGSSGEYNAREVAGWFVEVNNFTCPDWAENDPSYFPLYLEQQNLNEVASSCEVIGNIHDNPELLEARE